MIEILRESILNPLLNTRVVKLITIEAPAGSGKTTLLRQFEKQLSKRGWRLVVVQPNAGTDELALEYSLLRAIGASNPSSDIRSSYQGASLETLTSSFIQSLLSLQGHSYVIIDDFHLYKSPSAVKFITNLIYHEPSLPATIVVASRGSTDFPVSSLRLQGTFIEVGREDLKFSETEADTLRYSVDTNIDKAIWAAFCKKVDGWAVALQLALILLRENKLGISDLLNFSGTQREMASYLSQQIVGTIAAQDRALLFTVAAFDSLRPDVIVAVLGAKRADHLFNLITTFALPTEAAGRHSEFFHLHGVVLDFLKARASSEGVDLHSLQAKAGKFLEKKGELRKAIGYSLRSGNIASAAQMTERGGGWRLVYRGEEGTSRHFNDLSKMPRELFRSYPRTVLGLSISAAKRGEIDLALDLLEKITLVADPTDLTFAAELRLVGVLMDLYSDRLSTPEIVEQLKIDITSDNNDEDVDAVRLALTYNLLCYCSLQTPNFREAIHYGRLSIATFRDAQSNFGAAHLPLHIGQAEFFAGHIENAQETLCQHFEYCEETLGSNADLTLMTQALLTEISIEQGVRPTNNALLRETFIHLGKHDSWFDPLASLLVSQVRLALVDGNDIEAEAVLSLAESIAYHRHYQRLARLAENLRIEVLLKIGQFQEAEQLINRLANRLSESSAYDPVNLRGNPLNALQARLFLAKDAPEKALEYLDNLIKQQDSNKNMQRNIRLTLQKLQTLLALSDTTAAQNELDRLALTHRIDLYLLPFVEEGSMLTNFVIEYSANLDPHSLKHNRLAPAIDLITKLHPKSKAIIGNQFAKLTDTEAIVIMLLERGMTNKEIARDMAVTDNTIKYHLGNIFRKLDVKTRTAAITRARDMGILASLHR